MKPKHKRLIKILGLVSLVFSGGYIVLLSFQDNLIYYYSPKQLYEIKQQEPERFKKIYQDKIRVCGLIKTGSYKTEEGTNHIFKVSDEVRQISIYYNGLLPPMFREKQGVVAEGQLSNTESDIFEFKADKLVTKHDENYMPPEVKDNLEKNKYNPEAYKPDVKKSEDYQAKNSEPEK